MARDYARIMTAIWDNKEFCNLSEPSQRLYLLLVTQPDISAAGVLSLRVRRWAGMSRTSEPETLSRSLKELEAGRFIVADWTTEELLIRSFIRWDAGFNNPKRRPVIVRAGGEVRSERIGECLEVEFKRCGLLPDPPPTPSGGRSDTAPDSAPDRASKIHRADPGNEPFPQVDSLTDSYALEEGVVVTYLSREEPQPTTHNPVPPTAGSASAAARPPAALDIEPAGAECSAQTLVAEWLESLPHRPPNAVIGHASKAIKAMLGEGINPRHIRDGIGIWAAKGLHPSALPSAVNEAMNRPTRPTRTATALASVESAFAEWDARQARGETNLFALPPAHCSRGA